MTPQAFDRLLTQIHRAQFSDSSTAEECGQLLIDAACGCSDRQWREVQGVLEWGWMREQKAEATK